MDASTIKIIGAFEEFDFWMDYTAPKLFHSSKAERAHVQLFIGESKLGGGRPFISGIWQAVGQIIESADQGRQIQIFLQTPYSLKWENCKILRVLDKQVMPHRVVVETYKGSQHIGNHNNPHF